ncbi:hypothetical protein JFL43_04820 [Viridibacillus sp. YIM B01967]|uniref:Uncharacterized protein n=1 Tax=Viridibacillus soli TaxID=2798301 RepID=A0ABS1H4G6_9BACL|nr:hypothetical protein [Viridibacillus soli]MBK3494189.1 hypothetical protein [Viridibacillus soli]
MPLFVAITRGSVVLFDESTITGFRSLPLFVAITRGSVVLFDAVVTITGFRSLP